MKRTNFIHRYLVDRAPKDATQYQFKNENFLESYMKYEKGDISFYNMNLKRWIGTAGVVEESTYPLEYFANPQNFYTVEKGEPQ